MEVTPFEKGAFRLGMADPPWRFEVFDRATGLEKSPDSHYETMQLDELKALPVGDLFASNALFAMWVYDPMLPQAIELADAWGFRFVTPLFRWLKATDGQWRLFEDGERLGFGTGYHTRGGGCEECWLFKRGTGLKVLRHDIRKEFYAPRREHSRKPDEVASWMVDLYGDVPRIELFARTRRNGWCSWGKETNKFAEVAT